jgi:hypothetical protein
MASVLQPFELFLLLHAVPEGRNPEHLQILTSAAETLKKELEFYDSLELEQKIVFAKKVSNFLEQATLALIKLYEAPREG